MIMRGIFRKVNRKTPILATSGNRILVYISNLFACLLWLGLVRPQRESRNGPPAAIVGKDSNAKARYQVTN